MDRSYYGALAAAYLRGRFSLQANADNAATVAKNNNVRIHRFKRNSELPRVRAAIGALRGLAPQSLLDIGSGRGTFLWPLLESLPQLSVMATDIAEYRVDDINAMHSGGVERLRATLVSSETLPFTNNAFDITSALEVLEHQSQPSQLAAEIVRCTQRAIVASVPFKPDENPEHVQLFTPDSLTALFENAGAKRVSISHVPNHIIAVVTL